MKGEDYIDPRIIRTKKYLHKAMRELILEKDYRKISITDLTNRAGLARPTFYLHYETKEDLLKEVFNEFLEPVHKEFWDTLEAMPDDIDARVDIFTKLLLKFEQNKQLIKAVTQSGYVGLIQEDSMQMIRHYIRRLSDKLNVKLSDEKLELVTQYLVGAYTQIVLQWLLSERRTDPRIPARIYILLSDQDLNYMFSKSGMNELS